MELRRYIVLVVQQGEEQPLMAEHAVPGEKPGLSVREGEIGRGGRREREGMKKIRGEGKDSCCLNFPPASVPLVNQS